MLGYQGVVSPAKPQRQSGTSGSRPKVDEWETVLCDLTFE